jgi:hypothetical protein
MMNFETKYLIRWGIPGWVFIVFSYVSYLSYGNNLFLGNEFTVTQLLGIMISLGFVGIVLGYLMHQMYFSVNWIFSKQSSKIMEKMFAIIEHTEGINGIDRHRFNHHKAYFMLEFHWQKQLILSDKDHREYVSERYRYMLSTIHGLGALLVSIVLSIITVCILIYNYGHSFFTGLIILLLFYLGYSVWKGFGYYSENLIYFQANFINAFHNNELQKPNIEEIEIK